MQTFVLVVTVVIAIYMFTLPFWDETPDVTVPHGRLNAILGNQGVMMLASIGGCVCMWFLLWAFPANHVGLTAWSDTQNSHASWSLFLFAAFVLAASIVQSVMTALGGICLLAWLGSVLQPREIPGSYTMLIWGSVTLPFGIWLFLAIPTLLPTLPLLS